MKRSKSIYLLVPVNKSKYIVIKIILNIVFSLYTFS